MDIDDDSGFEEWKKRRRRTFKAFCFLACCLGAEYSIIIPSLWFYLHDVIRAEDAKTFYGITLAVYYVSAIIGSFTITRIVDRTRNVRLVVLLLLICEIIGNILYAVPTSKYFPLIGRFIQGLGDVNMSIIVAEIARSFEKEKTVKNMSTIVTCFSVTFVVSPAMNVIFKYINVNVLGWQLNYGNLPGLFMAMFFIACFVVVLMFMSDLSKEYDLKEATQKRSTTEVDTECQPESSTSDRIDQTPFRILRHFDFIYFVLLGFLMSLSVVAFIDVVAPIYGKEYFHFTSRDVGILFFVTSLMFIVAVNIMRKLTDRISEYYFLFIGLAIFMTSTFLLLVLSIVKKRNFYVGVTLYVSFVLLLGVCWCIEQVLIRATLSKIVPSSCQTLAEGIRRSASSLACIISSLLMPRLLDQVHIVCVVVNTCCFVAVIVLRMRKKTLQVPQVITLK